VESLFSLTEVVVLIRSEVDSPCRLIPLVRFSFTSPFTPLETHRPLFLLEIMPKHWTLREEEDPNIIHHQGLIGAGGYGEVHQVQLLRIAIPNAQLFNSETNEVLCLVRGTDWS
jgi:hypothetical protein